MTPVPDYLRFQGATFQACLAATWMVAVLGGWWGGAHSIFMAPVFLLASILMGMGWRYLCRNKAAKAALALVLPLLGAAACAGTEFVQMPAWAWLSLVGMALFGGFALPGRKRPQIASAVSALLGRVSPKLALQFEHFLSWTLFIWNIPKNIPAYSGNWNTLATRQKYVRSIFCAIECGAGAAIMVLFGLDMLASTEVPWLVSFAATGLAPFAISRNIVGGAMDKAHCVDMDELAQQTWHPDICMAEWGYYGRAHSPSHRSLAGLDAESRSLRRADEIRARMQARQLDQSTHPVGNTTGHARRL